MQHRTCKYLWDILQASQALLEFAAGKTFADYEGDRMLRSAVERQFEIIGEALRQLAQIDQPTAERVPEYQQIIAFRNRLIHGYDLVDHLVVWRVLQRQMGALRSQIEALLRELDPDYDQR
jgi:uncharacterized protein with HEPN domain